MFKLLFFFALLAIAFAVPKAEPQPQFYYGGYGGLGYSAIGYGHGYAAPYAYGGYGSYYY
ncbi:prismalin-14-like [Tribolium madens]|uniref:prismalin-14-like n=1 Tax=Tribolium madens TaxID=41895 RepID=UPI001CF73256|nr:prismalin-14-like [Tribolium madens]